MREKVCQSDVLYTAWQDERICQGSDDIAKRDKRVCDHADIGKCCKAPDEIGPPLTYMEECRDFQACGGHKQPYGALQVLSDELQEVQCAHWAEVCTNCARNIQGMVELAKGVRRPLTIIVFEGESVTPLCLLQELHSRLTLSCIMISTPEEAKVGPKNCVSCCPIYVHVCGPKRLLIPESHHCWALLE